MSRWQKQLGALVATSAREFVRDRLAMFFTFGFPLLFMLSFALTSPHSDAPRLELDVVDHARSAASQQLIERLRNIATIKLRQNDAADKDGVLEIRPALASASAAQPAENSLAALFPGLLALALLELGLVATATPILTARQRGSLQHLLLSPVNRLAAVSAHVTVRVVIALVQLASMTLLAERLFGFHASGALLPDVLLLVLEAVMLVSLGYLAGALLPASDASYGFLTILNLAFLLLGGVFDGPAKAPSLAKLISPLYYAADANRQLLAGAPGGLPLATDVAAMTAWIVACALAAAGALTLHRKR